MSNEKSFKKQLTTRIYGLSLVSKSANFKTKLMVGNAIVISKISYLIQLWGGTHDYLIKALQVTMNRAARLITGQSWFTPTTVLLRKCQWLSVKQLVAYHTLLTVHSTINTQKPAYLHNKMCPVTEQHTRQIVKFDDRFTGRSEKTKSSFYYRGVMLFNRLPAEIQGIQSKEGFKRKMKKWVLMNIPVE